MKEFDVRIEKEVCGFNFKELFTQKMHYIYQYMRPV